MGSHDETLDETAKAQIEKAKAQGWKIELRNNGWFELLTPEDSRIGPLHCLHHLAPTELEALAWRSLLAEAHADARIRNALFMG
jgi:hypothetical protein